MKCAIHTTVESSSPMETDGDTPQLPSDLTQSIKSTIGRALDFVCDVISCSPEQLRLPKTEHAIRKDQELSQLTSRYYGNDTESDKMEFALALWHDEKHTRAQVEDQVSRACKELKAFGRRVANEMDSIGRSIIKYDSDIQKLLKISRTIEQIKLTVTIRSSRDTFREQMCGTIIEWLGDIAGCSVGGNPDILRNTICHELLGVWQEGSKASNADVGKEGIDDHAFAEERQEQLIRRQITTVPVEIQEAEPDDMDMDGDEGQDDDGENEDEHGEDEDDVDMVGSNIGSQDEEDLLGDSGRAPFIPPSLRLAEPFNPPVQSEERHTSVDRPAEEEEEEEEEEQVGFSRIPQTPRYHSSIGAPTAPDHWLERPPGYSSRQPLPPYEDLRQRVRLDWLIMFDLRIWKKARIDLRDLYISTVVAIPQFKRILGLRFAGLYPTLAQLYLIADREPDHSIINMSLQMLTTPSITAEVVRRANFFTNLMAILYTFLTTRQVSYPRQVHSEATLAFDSTSLTNPLTNRRMYHFFADMRYLLGCDYVQEQLRIAPRYTLQFLDLIKLHQGICPNIRAISEHVEYEPDAWISAALVTREINKLSRQFAEAFRLDRKPEGSLQRTISTAASYAIYSSMGWERHRYSQTEMKAATDFTPPIQFEFDTDRWGNKNSYNVVRFAVDKQPISFHHALHYTLSWLIAAGKGMSVDALRELLSVDMNTRVGDMRQELRAEDRMLAMFDIPLRVCVWLAQIKAGMWVRNGFSLRHQMSTYRSVSQRDLTHNRDIFLLQTSLVTVNPSRMLANMANRFGLMHWMGGNYDTPDGYEEAQVLDLAEEFLHLLIVILSDRLPLIPPEEEPEIPVLKIRKELVHILCFKPMQFSELANRLPEKLQDHQKFQEVLQEMTTFRPPEGLSDSGTFGLKEKYLDDVDPYIMQFSKNQREDTEHQYRVRMAKKTGKPETDIVFEPHLRPVRSGIFANISAFTGTPVFAQIIYYSLAYALQFKTSTPSIPSSRVEIFLQLSLHLCLLAVMEDNTPEGQEENNSFIMHALEKEAMNAIGLTSHETQGSDRGHKTIATVLHRLSSMEDFKSCWAKVNHVLRTMKEKKPNAFSSVASWASGMGVQAEVDETSTQESEVERKKQIAKDRQAKIMAQMKLQQQSFMNSAGVDFGDDSEDDSDGTLPAEEHKWWKYPTGTCILCQEEMNDSRIYGCLSLVTESHILRQTDLTNAGYAYEVAKNPESLDRPADDIRPYGVASMNLDKLKKMSPDGTEVFVERQGLGGGFPPDKVKNGPVAVGCNHLMHFSCFEHYYESTRRRHPHQIARNHPERLEKLEFVCPLCKALGNAFLPVVWRAKEETPTGVLYPKKSFNGWLGEVGPSVNRLDKAVDGIQEGIAKSQEMFKEYGKSQIIASISNRLANLPTSPEGYQDVRPTIAASISNFGAAVMDGIPRSQLISMAAPLMQTELEELRRIYRRLRDTYKDNNIASDYRPDSRPLYKSELTHCDSLAQTLGFSISAVEIAQRGVGSEPGSTLLDRISPQVLTHLRVLSETVSSYYAIGSLQSKEPTKTIVQFHSMQRAQLQRLFVGHQQIYAEFNIEQTKNLQPLLCSDLFVFVAECSVCTVPAMNWDVMHIIQLCYIAELIKSIVAISRDLDFTDVLNKWERAEQLAEVEGHIGYTERQLDTFRKIVGFVRRSLGAHEDFDISSFSLAVFRHMVGHYATPFLRKCIILLHVRYGLLFPPSGFGDIEESEQYRLCQVLRLPSVDDIFDICLADDPAGNVLRELISGWCKHAAPEKTVSLSHPSIFELVGLPSTFDVLVEEASKRRCPTTGRDVTEAVVCLFCGDIFCSQAHCCLEDVGGKKIGGCNKHMKK